MGAWSTAFDIYCSTVSQLPCPSLIEGCGQILHIFLYPADNTNLRTTGDNDEESGCPLTSTHDTVASHAHPTTATQCGGGEPIVRRQTPWPRPLGSDANATARSQTPQCQAPANANTVSTTTPRPAKIHVPWRWCQPHTNAITTLKREGDKLHNSANNLHTTLATPEHWDQGAQRWTTQHQDNNHANVANPTMV